MLSCVPHAGLMGVGTVKRPSWTQRQAETQPNVSHPLEVTSYTDVVTPTLYGNVVE